MKRSMKRLWLKDGPMDRQTKWGVDSTLLSHATKTRGANFSFSLDGTTVVICALEQVLCPLHSAICSAFVWLCKYEKTCIAAHQWGYYSSLSSFSLLRSIPLFLILRRINKGVYWSLFEHADTSKHVFEQHCSSMRVFLSILAHIAHLAQSYFSRIFSAINTFKCSWFNLGNK